MVPQIPRKQLKQGISKLLWQVGLYQRVKASWIYDIYWRVADRQIIDDKRQESDFYRKLLHGFRQGGLIFDIGANQGYKTDIFLGLGAKVVAVEPDEASQRVLTERFLMYRLKKKPVVIVANALSDRRAVEKMWIDRPGSAKNTLSQKWAEILKEDGSRFGHKLNFGYWREVYTIPIEELIQTHGVPFFIKIDVEGHELNVLRGLRQPVPYLSFEVNLPEFKTEGLSCVQLLRDLAPDSKFNYAADCRHGLILDQWLRAQEFHAVLSSCSAKSIEVFWNTSGATK